jgi:hypothetical protein
VRLGGATVTTRTLAVLGRMVLIGIAVFGAFWLLRACTGGG